MCFHHANIMIYFTTSLSSKSNHGPADDSWMKQTVVATFERNKIIYHLLYSYEIKHSLAFREQKHTRVFDLYIYRIVHVVITAWHLQVFVYHVLQDRNVVMVPSWSRLKIAWLVLIVEREKIFVKRVLLVNIFKLVFHFNNVVPKCSMKIYFIWERIALDINSGILCVCGVTPWYCGTHTEQAKKLLDR